MTSFSLKIFGFILDPNDLLNTLMAYLELSSQENNGNTIYSGKSVYAVFIALLSQLTPV